MTQNITSNNLSKSPSICKHNAIVRRDKGIILENIRTPIIRRGELLIAPLIVGLCGTDIQILRGERNDPSKIIGHEGVAKIVQIGDGCSTRFKIGDNVIINPTNPYNEKFLLGHNVDGLFQEYVRIPKDVIKNGLVLPVLEDFPLEMAPLIEPLAAVIYSFQLLQPHGTIIIYGDGIIGHLAVLFIRARLDRSIKIIFIHHLRDGLLWSINKKIHGDFDMLNSDLADKIKFAKLPIADFAIIATPRSSTLKCLGHAIANVAPGGKIDILGGVPDGARLPSLPEIDLVKLRMLNCGGMPTCGVCISAKTVSNKSIVLCGHRGVSEEHLISSMKELTLNMTLYSKLITHKLNLYEATSFMNSLANSGYREINAKRVIKLGIYINYPLNKDYNHVKSTY